MLYERWRQVARENAGEIALRDLASSRAWSFDALASAVESAPVPEPEERMVFPSGHSPEFILGILRAWRFRQIVCPLESGQTAPIIPTPPPNICLLKTTSATTGVARHVAFTARQLAADPENIVRTMGLRRNSPNLGVISLAHSYGFSNLVLPLLLHGIPLTLVPNALPETLRQAAATGENWTLPAVPALWRTWAEAGALSGNLRLAISAGAPLPPTLEDAVHARFGLKLHTFLGSTECGGIAYDAAPLPRGDGVFAGTALHGVHLSRGDDGHLIVRGAAVGEQYWPAAEDRLHDGVFHTNDLVDLEGNQVLLRGRAGDLINVAGRKVAPESIEAALRAHPAVRECLVLGVHSAEASRGDIVAAVVECRSPVTREALRDFLHSRLPEWQIPREWHLLDSLPVNARGKLSRTEWRQRLRPERA